MSPDDLRTLMQSRVADPPGNPARPAEVRSRIAAIRRRRTAGGALALVLLALASVVALRLPGTNESLPPGVPKPPYFTGGLEPRIPGWQWAGSIDEGQDSAALYGGVRQLRYLFVVRCEQEGDLTLRNADGGEPFVVPCRTEVDDHFEGAAELSAERAATLFRLSADPSNVRVDRGSPGEWVIQLLNSRAPERLPAAYPPGGFLLDGRRDPDGTTVAITVPPVQSGVPAEAGFSITVECVAGVRVTFRVPAGELGEVACDPYAEEPEKAMDQGRVTLFVPGTDMRRLDLVRGRQVQLTVTRTGRDTDQWRVFPPS